MHITAEVASSFYCDNLGVDPEQATAIKNNKITGNTAANEDGVGCGGAIYCYYSSPTITDNYEITYNSSWCGGAIYYGDADPDYLSCPPISNNGFDHNSARDGGAIYAAGSYTTIANNTFTENTASYFSAFGGHGGAIYFAGNASADIMSNTFTGNSANGNYGANGQGGAIYCGEASSVPNLYITYNTFTDNSASNTSTYSSGGAIYSAGYSALDIENNTFTGNSAGRGGAICLSGGYSTAYIAKNAITDNSANRGGAVYSDGGGAVLLNNLITENSADEGGVVYCLAAITMVNNVITDNTAVYYGGVVYMAEPSGADITNNTIVGNSADYDGGAIYCDEYSEPVITNNIVMANTATGQGGGIWCNALASPTLNRNDFYGNTAGTGNNYYPTDLENDDISADPEFADAGNGDYRLTSESEECIDAGNNNAIDGYDTDYVGNPRVFDGDGDEDEIVDIGAYEYCPGWASPPNGTPPFAEWFNPGWVWFSIPLVPTGSASPADILGSTSSLFRWNDVTKNNELYPYDNFAVLEVGRGYKQYVSASFGAGYLGAEPTLPFEHTVYYGTCLVGCPGSANITPDNIWVTDGQDIRTVQEDYAEGAGAWINWNWVYWDSYNDTYKIACLNGGSGDDDRLRPWYAYQITVTSVTPVTLIFWPEE